MARQVLLTAALFYSALVPMGRAAPSSRFGRAVRQNLRSAFGCTWVPIDSPDTAPHRSAQACCYDPVHDQIYMYGGLGGENLMQRYDPDSNAWTDLAPMFSARSDIKGIYCRGRVYAIGGWWHVNGRVTDSCEAFDVTSGTWSTISPIPALVDQYQAAVWRDSLIYIMGGHGGLSSVWVYDPFRDTWRAGTPMLASAERGDACIIGDTIYFAGVYSFSIGSDDGAMRVGAIDVDSPSHITWSWGTALPSPRDNAPTITLNGRVCWFGMNFNASNWSYVYDPATRAIGRLPDYPLPVVQDGGVARAARTQIYGLGGLNMASDSAAGYYKLDLTQYHNIGITKILGVNARVDSGDTVHPTVVIGNSGAFPLGCRAYMNIDSLALGFDSVYLKPGQIDTVGFPGWPATVRGFYAAHCSLTVSDDQPGDDTLSDTFRVRVLHDVGVTRILVPGAQVDSGDTIVPAAEVRNYGRIPISCRVLFRVPGANVETSTVSLLPRDSAQVAFAPWTVNILRMLHTVVCSTMLAGDEDSSNDAVVQSLWVRVFDVGMGTVYLGDTVAQGSFTPLVEVYNRGSNNESLDLFWRMFRDDTLTVYAKAETAYVDPGYSPIVHFPRWQATPGLYRAKVFALYQGAMLRDTIEKHFLVPGGGIAGRDQVPLPREFALEVPAPNPCGDRAIVRYALPHVAEVSLKLYDASGHAMRTLVDEKQPAGWYQVAWDGNDDRQRRLSAGIYFLRLSTPEAERTRKVVLTE